ncbi:thymidylate kinase [Bacteroidia bacterium]|nr:thymidylate kinase [Bacteroidia bacterium]
MQKKPLLIAVEGADKSGKRTQVLEICKYLESRGIPVETIDFPRYNRSPWGDMAAAYLRGEYGEVMDIPAEYKMLPYALDRADFQAQLRSFLDAGKWVVFDRYAYSNLFSVAQNPPELWDEKIRYLETLEFDWLNIMRSDHNIYLALDAKISHSLRNTALKDYQKQQANLDIHERNLDLLASVAKAYHYVAARDPAHWTVINQMQPDGSRMTISEVSAVIFKQIDKLIDANQQDKLI